RPTCPYGGAFGVTPTWRLARFCGFAWPASPQPAGFPGRASPPPGLEPRDFLVEGLPRRGGAALIEHDLLRQPLRHGDHPHRPPPDGGIVRSGRRPAAITSSQVEDPPIEGTDDPTRL